MARETAADGGREASGLATAGLRDTLAFVGQVVLPVLAKGPLVRRPRVVGMSERMDLDGRAVRRTAALRARYGEGPLVLPIPGRHHALLLSPADVHRVLQGEPKPFSPCTEEKHAALAHFEPRVSLVSTGAERAERRRLNERTLESETPMHALAAPMLAVVAEEADRMLRAADGRLDWDGFFRDWNRVIRRVVLGDAAHDDTDLTDMLETLRRTGNYVYLRPKHRRLRRRLLERVQDYLTRAEPGSLAAAMAALAPSRQAAPADQLVHYLFAFDPGGMATFRALALLAAHPEALARARADAAEAGPDGVPAFLRATLLESLRLWPTTPVILRQTTRPTDWSGAAMPAGMSIIIFAPYFHRHDGLPFAHRFAPEIWLTGTQQDGASGVRTDVDGPLALVPFSAGGGRCPAANFVPMIAGAMLARLIERHDPALDQPGRLDANAPMPAILDNYTLRLTLRPIA